MGSSILRSQVFTVDGNFTGPTGVTLVWVTLVGTGAKGGDTPAGAGGLGGGGGGAGETVYRIPVCITSGEVVPIIVGDNSSHTPDDTEFQADSGTVSAQGGAIQDGGGEKGAITAGGEGGIYLSGAGGSAGGDGTTPTAGGNNQRFAGGSPGSLGGGGGASAMGNGGAGGTGGMFGADGSAPTLGYGGGGGGACGGTLAHNGGLGANGVVIVEWMESI